MGWDRHRARLLLGILWASVIAALAFGPNVPPPGAPHASAEIDGAVEDLQSQPVIYQPCKRLAWVAGFGVGCALQLDEEHGD